MLQVDNNNGPFASLSKAKNALGLPGAGAHMTKRWVPPLLFQVPSSKEPNSSALVASFAYHSPSKSCV
ncbi:hypothetical protein L484_006285 [Morus notabilis]|uniref:Uncharacterized protein n=1 Tax=Morus notabilis TaxID=981085 RepID=W9R298_9ROSA|nr:hypothetical protein L484_006285 [Morus notabilis]